MNHRHPTTVRIGHTLLELIVAMVCSSILLAGLGSVMFIASEVAYSPSAAARRTESADIVNQISEELRYATLIIQQTPQILEFVVADRNADGTAEKIRYAWSGTAGAPLFRTYNTNTPAQILDSVHAFSVAFEAKAETTALTTTVDSAEQVLVGNTAVLSGSDRDVTNTSYIAHQVYPSTFASIPANVVSWTATKIEFYGSRSGAATESMLMQLRTAGDPNDGPTSNVLGQVSVPESALTSSAGWNVVTFTTPIRNLTMHGRYSLVWAGVGGAAARIRVNDSFPTGVLESSDAGASWQYNTTRQLYAQIRGTYATPGPTYNVAKNLVTHTRLVLRTGEATHSRIDASVPLVNRPELLAAYWRADFDRNPTTTNANGDAVSDWLLTGGSFDPATLIAGVWYAAGTLETRPLSNFTTTTVVEARCRNTSVGGNGAVVRIYADRQSGHYAPLFVYLQRQADGTQTLSLLGKTSDAATSQLFTRSRLADDFVRFRLTILPQNNVVNLQINDEDQGTYTYPTYAPATTSDRFLSLNADTSTAQFDYVEVRAASN